MIAYDIVSVCRNGSSKTHVVYAANLNSERANGYLNTCIDLELIGKEKNYAGHTVYKTTDFGLRFLKSHNDMLAEKESKIHSARYK